MIVKMKLITHIYLIFGSYFYKSIIKFNALNKIIALECYVLHLIMQTISNQKVIINLEDISQQKCVFFHSHSKQ